ncbi:hypothetical protein IR022_15650 [Dysgonomonas sp. GY617]|nr:hypothetical protein [Dysgonomonas sp. GY617]
MITLRASFLIERVIDGLSIDFNKALSLLKNHNDFTTEQERLQREILVTAIDNLVDFAASQEQQMLEDLPDELDNNHTEQYETVFEKYNLGYASQENQDVLYAAGVAAWWITVQEETLVTFMTQGDDRVRDWHLSLEGLSFLKRDFPSDLIPPIEWGCRCYLISDGFGSVYGSTKSTDQAMKVNPVFRESLATGGKIFSEMHPYFQIERIKPIQVIADRIKQKFHLL